MKHRLGRAFTLAAAIAICGSSWAAPNHWIEGTALAPKPVGPNAQWRPGWSDYATATAAGYCLAKHPYVYGGSVTTAASGRRYTADGYELVGSPGIAGAVRRNFVYTRSTYASDEGAGQSCAKACAQFGAGYKGLVGQPLHQLFGGGERTNGLGDISATAYTDQSYYLNTPVIAGISSRANTWHESDVAEADMCCCQVVYPR